MDYQNPTSASVSYSNSERGGNTPIFLGVCASALIRGDGVLQDFYQVGEVLALPYFPQRLSGAFLMIAFPLMNREDASTYRIVLKDKLDPSRSAWINLGWQFFTPPNSDGSARLDGFHHHYASLDEVDENNLSFSATPLLLPPSDSQYKLVPIPCPPYFVLEPSNIEVIVESSKEEVVLGSFHCAWCKPPPLVDAERQAIKSRPGAIDFLMVKFQCRKCGQTATFYAALEEDKDRPDDIKDAIKIRDAPDLWSCSCGENDIPLIYLKDGHQDLFRRASFKGEKKELSFRPMYEQGAINAITSEYMCLIASNPDEEAVQKYLESKPILWNFLSPQRIWRKPPLLNKHIADFGILTRTKTLILVEIEKPGTKLGRKDHGMHFKLQKGFDQIREWRLIVEDHRAAFFDQLSLDKQDVHDVRYMLIAGLSSKTPSETLARIRRNNAVADYFFCFDELASFLHSTEAAIRNV